jgi:PncC family amidohydrolase
LTALGEAAGCYLGGVVAPSAAAKTALLNVPADLIASAGSISREVAAAMARGCRERFRADFALAITECPPFHPERDRERAPSAFYALVGDGLEETHEQTILGDAALIRSRAAKSMLDALRLHLLR